MKKVEIDIKDKRDLLDKYNTKKVSKDLNNYLSDENPIKLINEGFKVEYEKCLKKHIIIDLRQLFYLILGIIDIFIATLFETEVLHEIILISGWVFIWEMVELEIFTDRDNYKKRKVLKKLLDSEFIDNKISK